jgi:hypothetical protein
MTALALRPRGIRDSLFGFLLVFSIILDYVITKKQAENLNRKAIMASRAANN